MIFVNSDLSAWLKKHPGLQVLKLNCDSCNKQMVSNKPFVEKGYVGLISEPCSCGKNKHVCVSKLTTSIDSFNHWMSLVKNYL